MCTFSIVICHPHHIYKFSLSRLQPGLSLESSFGELFWRAYLESPLKKLLWKLIVFHGFQKSHSQQPPGRLQVVSQGTPSGLPVDSQRTPSGLLADSQWIPIGLPADSQQTPSRLPADSHRIPSGLPADSHWTPSLKNGAFVTKFGSL